LICFGRIGFGDEGYAMEELVTELGSAFLCADSEITPENSREPRRRVTIGRLSSI
jgi:antirestriction protein ArdC